MVFVADDLGAWLVGLLADAGRKKLTALVLGSDQERALRQAATAAVQVTAQELRPQGGEQADELAMVVSQVFSEPVPDIPARQATLLEALQAGIAGQLTVLDDASLTGTGQSSADLLGVLPTVVIDSLFRHLLREILNRGAHGGPLTPLADQLNHDMTHLQNQRVEDILRRLDNEVRKAPTRPDIRQTVEAITRRGKVAGHVFISYVHEDSLRVDQLQRSLRDAGIPVWRDTADLWPGQDWRAKIRRAITDNALVFIACFSRASLARDKSFQNEELTLAIEQLRLRHPDNPWLIPVRFDDCDLPDRDLGGGRTLTSIQYADLFGDRFDGSATRLVAAILQILGGHPDAHAPKGDRDREAPINVKSGHRPSDGYAKAAEETKDAKPRGSRTSSRRYNTEIPRSVTTEFLATARVPLLGNEALYRDVAYHAEIPWEMLAACDWMQAEARPKRSPVYGERLGAINPDGTVYQTRSAALAMCASDLIELSHRVYRIDLTARQALSVNELAQVFAAFRWGGLLQVHHCSAMEFPYSVAGLTSQHLAMRWPKINAAPQGWEKPGTRFRRPFGAVPVMLILDYPAVV